MRSLILCGGRGTRAFHPDLPKPLLDVAGRPILQHVLEVYARQGFDDFVLAAGYRLDAIERFAATLPSTLSVEVVDTGVDTNKGGRIARCLDKLGPRFFVTYADGIGNVRLDELLASHVSNGGKASVSVVPLPSQYGTLDVDDVGRVTRFNEKPTLFDHWINAGFLVFEASAFDGWDGEDLETGILPKLSASGELFAYRHNGFWKSMDTFKEAQELTTIALEHRDKGDAPWFNFATHASS